MREIVVLGIERIVSKKLERGAVILVGAGLGRDVDLPGGASELGRVDAGLHLELLERIHRRQHDVQIEIDIGVRDAVQRVVAPRCAAPESDIVTADRVPPWRPAACAGGANP